MPQFSGKRNHRLEVEGIPYTTSAVFPLVIASRLWQDEGAGSGADNGADAGDGAEEHGLRAEIQF